MERLCTPVHVSPVPQLYKICIKTKNIENILLYALISYIYNFINMSCDFMEEHCMCCVTLNLEQR